MPDNIINPHDKFFRETWVRREVIEDFIDHYMPVEISQHLDKQALQIEKDSFVDKDLRDHYSDILYSLRLNNDVPCQLYLLFDHKSYQDRFARLQLLRYMLNNWEQQRKAGKIKQELPPIIPVLVYHGDGGWRYDFQFIDLFCDDIPEAIKAYLPNFQHVMCDLSAISDEAIKGRVIIQIAMKLFKHIFDEDIAKQLPAILLLFKELAEKETGLEYLHTVLRYVGSAADIGKDEFKSIIRGTLSQLGEIIMATPAEQWIAEGLEKGIQQGELKGKMDTLLKQIQLKFGTVTLSVRKKVEAATLEQVTQWSEQILFANTVEDVFRSEER